MLNASLGLHQFTDLKDDFEKMLESGCDSPYLLAFLVDFYKESLEREGKDEVKKNRVLEVKLLKAYLLTGYLE